MKNEKARAKKRGGFVLFICLLLLMLMFVFCFPSFIMADTDSSETAATDGGTDTVVGEESVEVKAEDAESKEEINELKEQKGVLLFADSGRGAKCLKLTGAGYRQSIFELQQISKIRGLLYSLF